MRRDLMTIYGRLGLTIAAFALIVGIIVAPILPRLGPSAVAMTTPKNELTFRPLITPASLKTN